MTIVSSIDILHHKEELYIKKKYDLFFPQLLRHVILFNKNRNGKLKKHRSEEYIYIFQISKLLVIAYEISQWVDVHRFNEQAALYSHPIFFPLSIPFFGRAPLSDRS